MAKVKINTSTSVIIRQSARKGWNGQVIDCTLFEGTLADGQAFLNALNANRKQKGWSTQVDSNVGKGGYLGSLTGWRNGGDEFGIVIYEKKVWLETQERIVGGKVQSAGVDNLRSHDLEKEKVATKDEAIRKWSGNDPHTRPVTYYSQPTNPDAITKMRKDQGIDALAPTQASSVQDGTFTVEYTAGGYRTLKVETVKDGDLKGKQIVSFLSGPDNSTDFTGFAFVNERTGDLVTWKRFRGGNLESEAKVAWAAVKGDQKAAGLAYAMRSGRCCRCGRKLTVPASLHAGMGPECAKK